MYNILIVDDEIDNLHLLKRTFRKKYNVFMTNSSLKALDLIKQNKIDVVISDNKMPDLQGVELLEDVLNIAPETIRILITAYTDTKSLVSAINSAKIHRYVRKPFNPNALAEIVDSAIEIYKLNIDNIKLASDLKDLFSGTISAITEALDAKDSFTFGRSKRVTFYSLEIGKKLGLSDIALSELELAGLLHDIGMIGVPEYIINKPENLDGEEYESIKNHVLVGVKILEGIKQLEPVVEIIKLHHEKYDGSGYPYGLMADEIPMGARIIAVADAYDGMVSKRAYRDEMSHISALEEVQKSSGHQFDPDVVNAFIDIIGNAREKIKEIDLTIKSKLIE